MALKIILSYGGGKDGYGFQNFYLYYGQYKSHLFDKYFFQYLNDNDFSTSVMPNPLDTHWLVVFNTCLETHMYKFGNSADYWVSVVAMVLTTSYSVLQAESYRNAFL